MCIFPTVENCCLCIPLRIGMIYISVLAIVTGSISLTLIEQNSEYVQYALPFPVGIKAKDPSSPMYYPFFEFRFHYERTKSAAQKDLIAEKKVHFLLTILSAICNMSILWMVMGVVLLIAALKGEECLVYVFVVGMFLLIILGFLLAAAVTYECLVQESVPVIYRCIYEDDACLVRSMDWLTGSACIVFYVMYLFVWFYFMIVANSYALNGDTD